MQSECSNQGNKYLNYDNLKNKFSTHIHKIKIKIERKALTTKPKERQTFSAYNHIRFFYGYGRKKRN